MQLLTYSELKTKLQNDYDITDERFISETELLSYINEAIDDSETTIHTLHHEDKYFLCSTPLTLVNGTQDYAMPSNIYGNKIRLLYYNNGQRKYPVQRCKKLERVALFQQGDDYEYIIVNEEATGAPRIRLLPSPVEDGAYITNWYIRNMKRMTTSALATNVCEVPECVNFVFQHVRRSCAKKTRRADLIDMENEHLKQQYQAMCEALKDMTAEENNLIPMDLSSYYDQEIQLWR